MGIVVRDAASHELFFLQKGADVVMARIVQRNDWLEEETANMAREGLRTLVVARRKLSEAAYADFKARHHAASVRLEGRNEAMAAVVAETLERDLELLGLTGVEDKLQDDVRGTLELLRNAGIKIWMLTGDKIETATVIAISTKLVARNQYIHQVAKREFRFSCPYFVMYGTDHARRVVKTAEEAQNELDFLQNKLDCCLVIDGESLQVRTFPRPHACLAHGFPQLCLTLFKNEFIEITTKLSAVVACRCSPTQKADVARLIRNFTKKRVCCIGDGGNDVSMIQAADVGACPIFNGCSRSPTLTAAPPHRRWHRRQRGKAGLARSRLFRDAVQPPDEAPPLARPQLVSPLSQAGAVRHPPWADHLRHAGRLFFHLLLCAHRAVPGLAYGRLRYDIHHGACFFARA